MHGVMTHEIQLVTLEEILIIFNEAIGEFKDRVDQYQKALVAAMRGDLSLGLIQPIVLRDTLSVIRKTMMTDDMKLVWPVNRLNLLS